MLRKKDWASNEKKNGWINWIREEEIGIRGGLGKSVIWCGKYTRKIKALLRYLVIDELTPQNDISEKQDRVCLDYSLYVSLSFYLLHPLLLINILVNSLFSYKAIVYFFFVTCRSITSII